MTAILVLVAALFAALVFLANRDYLDGIDVLLGILGASGVLMILSLVIGLRSKKTVRKLYILYAPEDMAFVSKLYEAMKITPYKMLWDKKEIHVGDHIEEKTGQLLAESTDVIFVISQHSAPSDWSGPAIERVTKLKKRVFPILIDDAEPPEGLREIMFADFRSSFDDGYFSLRDALKAERQDPPPEKPAPSKPAQNKPERSTASADPDQQAG